MLKEYDLIDYPQNNVLFQKNLFVCVDVLHPSTQYFSHAGVMVSFFPSQFFPGLERMGRPVLSRGKKSFLKDLTSQFFPHPVSFFLPCYFMGKGLTSDMCHCGVKLN